MSAADELLELVPQLRAAMRKAPDGAELAEKVRKLAKRLQLEDAARTFKPNPALVIFGNPRQWRKMSTRVYGIEYKHSDDGENYRHDFKRPVTMYGLPNGDVLFRLER